MRTAQLFAFASAMVAIAAAPALAAEARPWLCRDKPVFSSTRPMEFQATARPGREWRLFIMQFQLDAANEGFDIVRSTGQLRAEPATGRLDPGSYYAVAMYRRESHWICPGYAQEDPNLTPGVVRKICYAEDSPPCRATLTVTPAPFVH